MSLGWAARRSPRALLDNAPLAHLLRRELNFHRVGQMLGARKLHALSITALSYTSGRHLTFYEGSEPIHAWRRAQRTARMVDLSVAHLLASSAIPFVFPAVPLVIDGRIEYFGDGSIRQIAPLSPAIHFGGDRIVVIGAAAARPEVPAANGHASAYPSLAQIGQQVLASVFLDSIGTDIEHIEHINRVVEHLPRQVEPESGWRHVDVLAIAPSERMELIAAKHLRRLPATVRALLGAMGGNQPAGASFASYLLFEAEFTRELIALGHADAMQQRETLAEWIASASPGGGSPPRVPRRCRQWWRRPGRSPSRASVRYPNRIAPIEAARLSGQNRDGSPHQCRGSVTAACYHWRRQIYPSGCWRRDPSPTLARTAPTTTAGLEPAPLRCVRGSVCFGRRAFCPHKRLRGSNRVAVPSASGARFSA